MIMSAEGLYVIAQLNLPAILAASLERGLPWLFTLAFTCAFARCLGHIYTQGLTFCSIVSVYLFRLPGPAISSPVGAYEELLTHRPEIMQGSA